ncbi:hypothetical protein SI65_00024 [Aspergillus cristatus]|uniref:BZIP domain-containing protein n=1 Tax=Aspergillus cristatus TaxID=573508 RepID=A0A1E3BPX5_ASPCR|nr:hypothetical protein SI65_00024 [Aspergillus cristatus]
MPPDSSSSDVTTPTDDDWHGIDDKIERRRRQNRVNQRAWRLRHKQHPQRDGLPSRSPSVNEPSALIPFVPPNHTHDGSSCSRPECFLISPETETLLERFESIAYTSYILGSPQADHLLTLVRGNIFRALFHNLSVLGLSKEWMNEDALSPLASDSQSHLVRDLAMLPVSLQPTVLQRSVEHHPWLDLFPLPRMRDNMIELGDALDEYQLCEDLMGFWNTHQNDSMLVVWGDPWDPRNWEVTEQFLRKWSWLIKGCPELIWSTNYWRHQRGEKRIAFRGYE